MQATNQRVGLTFNNKSVHVAYILWNYINPNTFAGLVGKVRKKLSPEGGRKGGGEKKRAQRARRTRGSNPGPAAC